MKIVILGAKGNLGSQLDFLLSQDHEVYSFDRDDFDVLNEAALFSVLNDLRPEVVFNCVAYNQVDNCEDKEIYKKAFALNCDLPAYLAELGLKLSFILIHYSTDYVFNGLESKKEFSEDDTPNPINKYGETKFLGEVAVKRQGERGLAYYLIRTSKLFGPIVENSNAKPSFFDIMMKLAQDKDELTVVNEELSCFTYTPDLAASSARLLMARPTYGVYHLVNEGPVTWYEGAKELFRLLKKEINIRPIRSENLARPARRPKFSVLQNNKVKRLRPYQEALKDYLRNK
ncbi:MAG: SDR family oxidoreductase [Patescibacteria group bacterium]|jgi:dTDP-4-dehydrorhamnose reductase|nr:NAD(P)-dependent oxidoreductase [bacterium]HQC49536.1 NAD(P)-dependent oxidoreductase [bacterium]